MNQASFTLGHVTHTFGQRDLREVFAAIARVGYRGVEPFDHHVSSWYDDVSSFRTMLEDSGLALTSVYCEAPLLDPIRIPEEIDGAVRAARFLVAMGARHIVIGPGPMPRGGERAVDYSRMARSLDSLGRTCASEGVILCYHPHVGGTVENRQQISAIFDQTDPAHVAFVPDTGHLAKGGSDIVEVVTAYRSRVKLLHLKDMDSTNTFVELGRGLLDNRAVLDILAEDGFDGWVLPEIPARDLSPEASALESFIELKRLVAEALSAGHRSGVKP